MSSETFSSLPHGLPPAEPGSGDLPSLDAITRMANAYYAEGQLNLQPLPLPVTPDPAFPNLTGAVSEDTLQALTSAINAEAAAATLPLPSTPGRFYFLSDQAAPRAAPLFPAAFNINAIRRDFPALHQQIHGKPLVWFDNAATTQKPQSVITAVSRFFEQDNSNVHRGAHTLATRSTDAYEGARATVQHFLGAASSNEVIFVRGATEAINLVANTYGNQHVGPGDEVLVTTLEHHSNIVPWQFLCREKGARLKAVPINARGEILLEEYEKLLGPRTKIVALTHVSNALGTVLPVQVMIHMAHRHGACVLVDGAQAVAHFPVNVQALDCDFYVMSGHKLFAPTGIGVLYGKQALLEEMPPWQGGGSMIDTVTFDETTFAGLPYKFEAGTGNIGGAVGLGAAIDYLSQIGVEAAAAYEQRLMEYAVQSLTDISGLRQIGTASHKVGVLSFVLDGIPNEQVGKFLDQEGIAVRTGHHCAQPSLQHFHLLSTVRPSLAFYNTHEEIDALVAAMHKMQHTIA